MTKPFFQTFTPNAIGDARATTEVLVALSYDSKAEVVAMIEKALESLRAAMTAAGLEFAGKR